MKLFESISDAAKRGLEFAKSSIPETEGLVFKSKGDDDTSVENENEDTKSSKMLQVMDWSFNKATGNIPGFGTAKDMAEKYLDKSDGSISTAVEKLIGWQVTSAATAGFVTNLGGLPLMPLTLPSNLAGVLAIQLRMIGAIAELSGADLSDEDTKTGMYLCLLGTEAGNILAKTTGQFAVKFATASLKKLPGAVLTKVNQAVGFRLFTKFGQHGLLNIHKAIPILGGIVSGTVDALSTFGIANAAKALFLKSYIDSEQEEKLEAERIRLLINLALVDGGYSTEETVFLKSIVTQLSLSDRTQETLFHEIDNPRKQDVDLTPFKEDLVLSASLFSAMAQVATADGKFHPAEKLYIFGLAKQIGFDKDTLESMFIKD